MLKELNLSQPRLLNNSTTKEKKKKKQQDKTWLNRVNSQPL
jgi:hypothetical protein